MSYLSPDEAKALYEQNNKIEDRLMTEREFRIRVRAVKKSLEKDQSYFKSKIILMLALLYKEAWIDQKDSAYLVAAENYFQKLVEYKLGFDNPFLNQANYELGDLYQQAKAYYDRQGQPFPRNIASITRDISRTIIACYARLKPVDSDKAIASQEETHLYLESRKRIAKLSENSVTPSDLKVIQKDYYQIKNDINALVANIDIVIHSAQDTIYLPAAEQKIKQLIDIDELKKDPAQLVFNPDARLSYEQAYKIAHLCYDQALIKAENYLDILWSLHEPIKNGDALADRHLRKKLKYQLLTTLLDLYSETQEEEVKGRCLQGLAKLYEDVKAKEWSLTAALAIKERKAIAAKSVIRQVRNYGGVKLKLTDPVTHLLEVFDAVTKLSRATFKLVFTIIGSIVDIVTVIPLFVKLASYIAMLAYNKFGIEGRGRWGQTLNSFWTDTAFTFLFKTLGDTLVAYTVGTPIALIAGIISYPVRLIAQLFSNCFRSTPEGEVNEAKIKSTLENNQLKVDRKAPNAYDTAKRYRNYESSAAVNQNYTLFSPQASAPPPLSEGVDREDARLLDHDNNALVPDEYHRMRNPFSNTDIEMPDEVFQQPHAFTR